MDAAISNSSSWCIVTEDLLAFASFCVGWQMAPPGASICEGPNHSQIPSEEWKCEKIHKFGRRVLRVLK